LRFGQDGKSEALDDIINRIPDNFYYDYKSLVSTPFLSSSEKIEDETLAGEAHTTPRLTGQAEAPILTGQAEAPTLTGQAEAPTLMGQAEAPILTGQAEAPILTGQAEAPILTGQAEAPSLTGQAEPSDEVPLPPSLLTLQYPFWLLQLRK